MSSAALAYLLRFNRWRYELKPLYNRPGIPSLLDPRRAGVGGWHVWKRGFCVFACLLPFGTFYWARRLFLFGIERLIVTLTLWRGTDVDRHGFKRMRIYSFS